MARNAVNELTTMFPTRRLLALEGVAQECNAQLESLDMEIRTGMVNGVRTYALVSTVGAGCATR